MAALTIVTSDRGVNGNKRWVRGEITFSTSYATSGDTGLTASALGMDIIDHMDISSVSDYNLEYVYATGAVMAFWYDFNLGSAAAAIQVTSTTNLASALASVRFYAIGV